ncbi:DUF5677 domain-containing protein [Streptomyces sp. NPDC055886]
MRFDTQILLRGANSLKAVRVLLEYGYWEYAAGVTRQIFELLVSMEHLGRMESRAEGTDLFARYGVLQFLLEQKRRITYDIDMGRPHDVEGLAMVERALQPDFDDFRANTKNGSVKYVDSWCRRTTADLAMASEDPMRIHQYKTLYRVWSQEVHATPGALVRDLFRSDEADWITDAIAENERSSKDTISFAIMLFLRLWMELPHVGQDPARVHGWLVELNRLNGGPELGPLPAHLAR